MFTLDSLYSNVNIGQSEHTEEIVHIGQSVHIGQNINTVHFEYT